MYDQSRSGMQSNTTPVLPLVAKGLFVRRKGRVLLDVDDITISGTGTTVLVGPNGAGKSLLLKVLSGLRVPDKGQITWNGLAPDRQRYCRFGFVLQNPVMLRRSALSNVEYALRAVGHETAETKRRARIVLEEAGLTSLAGASARVLSGGEMQRLALARALAAGPDLLFLDEPTSSLDPASVLAIEAMVKNASRDGMRIVLIAHDLAQAKRVGNDIIFMHRGIIAENVPIDQFFNHPGTPEAEAFIAGKILVPKERK